MKKSKKNRCRSIFHIIGERCAYPLDTFAFEFNNQFDLDSVFFIIKQTKIDSNQICCICLDISYSYFYILHIDDEIVAASFGSAVASGCFADGNSAGVDLIVVAAAAVTMRWDTDVTSSSCQPMDDILNSGNRNLDPAQRQHVNLAMDLVRCIQRIGSSHTF